MGRGSTPAQQRPRRIAWPMFVCLYYTKLEPIFKIGNDLAFPRACYARLCAKHRAFQEWKVRGNAERLKYWEMSRSRKMDSVLRNYFLGKGFAKPRLMFLKFGGDFGFRPRGGGVWGGIRAGFSFSFFARIKKEKYITLKSRRSRDTSFVLCLTTLPFAHKATPFLGNIIKWCGLLPKSKTARKINRKMLNLFYN